MPRNLHIFNNENERCQKLVANIQFDVMKITNTVQIFRYIFSINVTKYKRLTCRRGNEKVSPRITSEYNKDPMLNYLEHFRVLYKTQQKVLLRENLKRKVAQDFEISFLDRFHNVFSLY